MKIEKSLWISVSIILVSFTLLSTVWLYDFYQQKVVVLNQSQEKKNNTSSNAVFSEDIWRKQLEMFLEFKEKELVKPKVETNKETPQAPVHDTGLNSENIPPDQSSKNEKSEAKEAFLFSSLTNSPGSISISGKAVGYTVEVNDSPVPVNNSSFSTGAGSSFTATFIDGQNRRVVRVSSPSYSTNLAVQYLSIGIDPFASYMTLHVKLNLKLPGSMTGELINTTNGSASSTSTHNGEFNLSVPLTEGNNAITARGSWLTISLDLPSINVSLSN